MVTQISDDYILTNSVWYLKIKKKFYPLDRRKVKFVFEGIELRQFSPNLPL